MHHVKWENNFSLQRQSCVLNGCDRQAHSSWDFGNESQEEKKRLLLL
jgi:hypothetical protein